MSSQSTRMQLSSYTIHPELKPILQSLGSCGFNPLIHTLVTYMTDSKKQLTTSTRMLFHSAQKFPRNVWGVSCQIKKTFCTKVYTPPVQIHFQGRFSSYTIWKLPCQTISHLHFFYIKIWSPLPSLPYIQNNKHSSYQCVLHHQLETDGHHIDSGNMEAIYSNDVQLD